MLMMMRIALWFPLICTLRETPPGICCIGTPGSAATLERRNGFVAAGIDEYKVVPRLYAAGESVGGYWGDSRGHGKISGYMFQGRQAARDAASLSPQA